MSITALLWTSLYCSALVGTFSNPILGCLGYLLEYYMRPELKWWGRDLPDLRYNLIISMAIGASFVMRRSTLREMKDTSNPALKWLLGLGTVMLLVTGAFAVDTTVSWNWMGQWVKMAIVFPLLVVGVLRSRKAFDIFVMAHILGAFWWGWEAWNDPHREASRLLSVGSGDTLNDNAASSHLLTVIPFIVVYLLTAEERWKRAMALIALPFVVNTVILCNSRGATLGMMAAFAASMILVRRGDRLRMVAVGLAMAGALFVMADQQFITRQQGTADYEQDGSAQERLSSWRAAYKLVQDHPFGVGGRGFHLLSPIYIPDIVAAHKGDLRAPHNTWAMVASEWGVAGLVCYTGLFGAAFLMLRRIKKSSRESGSFYYWRALAIQLALIGHLVSSTFTDRLYGEAGYWMVALASALYRIQLTDQEEYAVTPVAVEIREGGVPEPRPRVSEVYG